MRAIHAVVRSVCPAVLLLSLAARRVAARQESSSTLWAVGVSDADVGDEPLVQEPRRLVGDGAFTVHTEGGAVGGQARAVGHRSWEGVG